MMRCIRSSGPLRFWARRCLHRARDGDRARFCRAMLSLTIPGSRRFRNGFNGNPTARDRYAENPPKKYPGHRQTPVCIAKSRDAETVGERCATSCCSDSREGVRIFRVDNPHTKPLPFWEWLIADVKSRDGSGNLKWSWTTRDHDRAALTWKPLFRWSLSFQAKPAMSPVGRLC